MPVISIVIPAYNEEARLARTLEKLSSELGNMDCEVIVVDDGSSDKTAEVASSFGVKVLELEHGGKGRALKAGMEVAKGKVVVISDADLPSPTWELQRLARMVLLGADVVIGSRRATGARVKRGAFRSFVGWCFHVMAKWITGLTYRDTQCGVKAFSRESAEKIAAMITEEGFAVDIDILMSARYLGLNVKEVGVCWTDMPGSKVRLFRDTWRMLCALVRLRRKYSALRARGAVQEEISSCDYSEGSALQVRSSM